MTVYILMGVSGTGKSTVGRAASDALGLPFIDADDLHSPHNIAKMSAGIPLDDIDRVEWREDITARLKDMREQTPGQDILLACSALGQNFRKRLRAAMDGDAYYLHLHGDLVTLKRRLTAREGHFFKPEMLASQFAALEMPARCVTLDIAQPVHSLVDAVANVIESRA